MPEQRSELHSESPADLLARYGELAAELEDTSDRERGRELETELTVLDGEIDRMSRRCRIE